MRKLTLLLAVLLSTAVYSQDASSKAKEALKKKYPAATGIEVNKAGKGYEAEFELDENYLLAKFDEKGNWTETRIPVSEDEMPAKAKSACTKKYPDGYIESVEKCEKLSSTEYEVIVNNNDVAYILTVTQDGSITSSKELYAEDE